jgi:hypothetical protein
MQIQFKAPAIENAAIFDRTGDGAVFDPFPKERLADGGRSSSYMCALRQCVARQVAFIQPHHAPAEIHRHHVA